MTHHLRQLRQERLKNKHHYRELTVEAQQSLGEIPHEFTQYWLSRFPRLLTHSWCAMQQFRSEPTLGVYYDSDYEYKSDKNDEDGANTILQAESCAPAWNKPQNSGVDWSPNRSRFRGPRNKQEKRKIPATCVWSLPPSS